MNDFTEDGKYACDICDAPATVNYQDVRARYDLTEELPRTPEIVYTMDDDNVFLCDEHDEPENR